MPEQYPSSSIISRSRRVRCSRRCASTSFPFPPIPAQPLGQFLLDPGPGPLHDILRQDVVAAGKEGALLQRFDDLSRQGINPGQSLDGVPKNSTRRARFSS